LPEFAPDSGPTNAISYLMFLTQSRPRTLAEAIDSNNGFNLVRLIAASLVLMYHCFSLNPVHPNTPDPLTYILAPVTNIGTIAVGVFFMISGIFISRSWMHDPHLPRFFLRRIARIMPALFVCVMLTTTVAVIFFSDSGASGLFSSGPWHYIFGNTVLHGLRTAVPPAELKIPAVLGGQDLNGPLWTLLWEGRMYVMLALIGAAAAMPMRIWLMVTSIFLLIATGLWPKVAAGYIWGLEMWPQFLTGILLFTIASQVRIGARQLICTLALAALGWTQWTINTSTGLTFFGASLICAAAALWLGSARFQGKAFFQKHDYSYGVYIYHWPIILMLKTAIPSLNEITMLLATLLIVLPLAMLSWHWVESPVLHFMRKKLRRPNREAVGAAPATAETAACAS
jgi:peptidoglycan/LPS O-acetylase OafA/YrhL